MPRQNVAMSEELLSIRGISKRFGGVRALSEISFDLVAGEVLGLVGDNGAGKSTLVKLISGVHQADEGEMRYLGKPIIANNPKIARGLGIETIYQDLSLADNLDVSSNVFLGREPCRRLLGLFPALNRRFMRHESQNILDSLGIKIEPQNFAKPVRNLSGGQRQAVAIGRAIYWKAKILIMDEPTASLGVPEQRSVKALIRNLKSKNVALIFISHNLGEILEVCDRILVLRRGVNVGERRTEETDGDEIVKLMVGA